MLRDFGRRCGALALVVVALFIGGIAGPSRASDETERLRPETVLFDWNRMVLALVRHTPTYSPPVASRAFAYLGVTAYEAAAGGTTNLTSLAGQLNGLGDVPAREPGAAYDESLVMHAALAFGANAFFGNTGPTGQRAMAAIERSLAERASRGVLPDVARRSLAHGEAVGAHILQWSEEDGGATVENLGFPHDYERDAGPGHWAPTNRAALQQAPLLPRWGENRAFAMPSGASCTLPAPAAYSEEPGSAFYREAMEVHDAVASLTAEQEAIARFWSDDPMLSPTPPGHWISIALEELRGNGAGLEESVDLFARLGVALGDAFIGCWHEKYRFDLVRPVTYINRVIDREWQPVLITPPFPEYPSGHSTQSGAAAAVLEHHFGKNYAFSDTTHEADGMPARSFSSFWAAAEEAAISRLYGGIHYRMAIDSGLDQGRCIAEYTNALKTRI